MDWLNLCGLVLNLVGIVMIMLSIGKPRLGGGLDANYIAMVNNPRVLKGGLGIMALGYLAQIAATFD